MTKNFVIYLWMLGAALFTAFMWVAGDDPTPQETFLFLNQMFMIVVLNLLYNTVQEQ